MDLSDINKEIQERATLWRAEMHNLASSKHLAHKSFIYYDYTNDLSRISVLLKETHFFSDRMAAFFFKRKSPPFPCPSGSIRLPWKILYILRALLHTSFWKRRLSYALLDRGSD